MPGDVNGLVRFRADPEKVRVAVRRTRSGWLATVGARTSTLVYYGRHRYAYRAVVLALIQAEKADLNGVDLGMGWAHFHPFATSRQRSHFEKELTSIKEANGR